MKKSLFRLFFRLVIVATCALIAGWPLFWVIETAIVSPSKGQELVSRSLGISLAEAGMGALIATIWGTYAALGARFLSTKVRTWLEVLCLAPVAIPPFVVAGVLRSVLGEYSNYIQGLIPVILVFGFSLTPLAYFSTRLMLQFVQSWQLDQARILGLGRFQIFRLVFGSPISSSVPLSLGITFTLALSDPLVPALLGGKKMNLAHALWLRSIGSFDLAFLGWGSLVLTGLSLCVSVLVGLGYTLGTYSDLGGEERSPQTFRFGFITGWRVFGIFSYAVVTLFLVTYILFKATFPWGRGEAIINTLFLALIVALICLLVLGATEATRIKAHHFGADLLFFFLLFLPGSAIGAGWILAKRSSGTQIGFLFDGNFLIICSFLLVALPVTHFLAEPLRGIVSVGRESAEVLGIQFSQLVWRVYFPAVWRYFSLILAVVVSISSTLSAPIIWVASSDKQVAVPQIFQLLDQANYSEAFGLSSVVFLASIITFVLLPKDVNK